MGFPVVDTKDVIAVAAEARDSYQEVCSDGDPEFVKRVFQWANDWFHGRYKDYLPIDAGYHDFEHTMQGVLCLIRLLRGRHRANDGDLLPRRLFELGVLAILMHDTGYLKHKTDTEGTGAKYTLIHVDRSAAFAEAYLSEAGYPAGDVRAVRNMIYCTAVDTKLEEVPFTDEQERLMGFAVTTSDLLGQMAADDYPDKLTDLYSEFAEAATFHGDRPGYVHKFKSERHLLETTAEFWEYYARPKIETHCRGLVRYLNDPYPDGPNEYLLNIEANLQRVKKRLDSYNAV